MTLGGNSILSYSAPVDDGSTVGSVKLKGGQTLPADVVVLGVGVGPQTDYLENSSEFTLEKDGSLKVDQYFKVEGFENIYATGNVAFVEMKW